MVNGGYKIRKIIHIGWAFAIRIVQALKRLAGYGREGTVTYPFSFRDGSEDRKMRTRQVAGEGADEKSGQVPGTDRTVARLVWPQSLCSQMRSSMR